MDKKGILQFLNQGFEWIYRLAILNFIWLFFIIVGLGIITIFPATVALFTVVNKWIKSDDHFSILSTFFQSFKNNFWKAHLVGLIISVSSFILYININFLLGFKTILPTIILVLTLNILLIFIIGISYLMPTIVHYDWGLSKHFKYATIIGIINPIRTLLLLTGVLSILLIFILMPLLVLFFGGSSIAFYITYISQKSFQRLDHKLLQVTYKN